MPAPTYKVGQPVYVRYNNGRTYPEGPNGVIEKVGRTLVHIRTNGFVEAFRIEDQRKNDRQYGYGTVFRTVEQWEASERSAKARGRLNKHGVRFDSPDSVPVETMEAVADLLDTLREA